MNICTSEGQDSAAVGELPETRCRGHQEPDEAKSKRSGATAWCVAGARAQEIAEVAVVRDHLQHARASTFLMGNRDQPGLLAVIFREVRNYLRRFTLIRIMLAVLAINPQVRVTAAAPHGAFRPLMSLSCRASPRFPCEGARDTALRCIELPRAEFGLGYQHPAAITGADCCMPGQQPP